MTREAGFVVGLVELGALLVLALWVARLLARGRRLARDVTELSRTVATVQGWAAQELRTLRSEFTVARVNDSAAVVMARRAEARAASAAPAAPAAPVPKLEDELEGEDDPRDTVATPAPAAKPGDDAGEATTFLEPVPPMYAPRTRLIRPPAPLAHSDLIGSEDAADEAARAQLRPDDPTPPRIGRSALLVPAFRGQTQGDDA